ncbi:MAG: ABC transporter substrate-binding protein [Pseudomonadota bacterium]
MLAAPALLARPAWSASPGLRIAALDWALTETMIVLGHDPIAVVAAADWPRFVVEPALPATTADLGLQQEINFELLAYLSPDVVLISPFLQRFAPQFERIAATINLSIYEDTGAPLALRESVTRDLGTYLGLDTEASRFLSETAADLGDLAARAASLPPRPILVVTFVDARHVRVYGPASLFHNVLSRLGMQNAWNREVGYFGFDMVGIEELATIGDAHLVTFDPVPAGVLPRLAESPIWSQLDFARFDRISILPPVLMFGALPSALRFGHLLIDELESRST